MSNLSLEDLVDNYIETVLEAVQVKNLFDLDAFYEYVFTKVSERTGFSAEEVKSLHHPFHWILFQGKNPPLELVPPRKMGNDYGIRVGQKDSPLEKSKLVADILNKYGVYLQKRLDMIPEHNS